jgi:hypothetical protein
MVQLDSSSFALGQKPYDLPIHQANFLQVEGDFRSFRLTVEQRLQL